jgi:YgiT-type zinc finger domain-containing protein
MKCTICRHGEAAPGRATVMLERGESVIVLKNVPADVCNNCGEYYPTAGMLDEAMRRANEAVGRGAVVEVIQFVA